MHRKPGLRLQLIRIRTTDDKSEKYSLTILKRLKNSNDDSCNRYNIAIEEAVP